MDQKKGKIIGKKTNRVTYDLIVVGIVFYSTITKEINTTVLKKL